MISASATAVFRRKVDRWVREAVTNRVGSFDELVGLLPGVYPTVVAESLARLIASGSIESSDHRSASQRATVKYRVAVDPALALLPPPHPLDFDWRYAPEAIECLLSRILDLTQPGDTVVMLGTPSLYLAASHRDLDRRFVLIDSSPPILERLESVGSPGTLHQLDLFVDPLPAFEAAVVVADPPWYGEYIEAFLWGASMCAGPSAHVLVSLPAVGTRPGCQRERSEFREVAGTQGLQTIATFSGVLPYLSPPFEVNALSAAGWGSLPPDWRRGDLVTLAARGKPNIRPTPPTPGPRWEERSFGWMRIRVRMSDATSVDPTLQQLVNGAVLSDVSRRHPLRDRATVWTSGNRIYGCAAPQVLVVILDAMVARTDASTRVAAHLRSTLSRAERQHVADTVSKICRIAEVEARELDLSGWPRRLDLADQSAM